VNARLPHGSAAWFDMVGNLMCEAAMRADLPADFDVSLVERYTDGEQLQDGLTQGLRFEIQGGKPLFRVGALPEECADITVEVTAAASRELNSLHAADPRFKRALTRLQGSGDMKIGGDFGRLGEWFTQVHDLIVDHTALSHAADL
jgi:hypothetical protein